MRSKLWLRPNHRYHQTFTRLFITNQVITHQCTSVATKAGSYHRAGATSGRRLGRRAAASSERAASERAASERRTANGGKRRREASLEREASGPAREGALRLVTPVGLPTDLMSLTSRECMTA